MDCVEIDLLTTGDGHLVFIRGSGLSVFLDVQMADENPVKWKAAMDKGVQCVQTDYPKALIEYLKTNNIRNGINVSRPQKTQN